MSAYPPPPPPPTGPIGAGYPPQPFDPKANQRAWKAQAKLQRRIADQQAWVQRQQWRALRRRSVIGPVLLLGFGVLFLLIETGKLSPSHALAWYGEWWPLLLIGSGLLLLAEWLLNGRRGAVLGGGMVTLLILLASVGWTANVSRRHWDWTRAPFAENWTFFGEAHQADDTASIAASGGGTLLIHNPHGDVSVTGASEDGQVHVSVHKEVRSLGNSELAEKLGGLKPVFTGTPEALTLSIGSVIGGHGDLQVTVPRGTAVTVDAEHGSVSIAEMHAPVLISAGQGEVSLSGIDGPVTAHLRNRNGELSAHSVTGAIAVDGRGGDLNFSDISGPVTMEGEFFGSTHLERVNGAVSFQTFRTTFKLARLDGTIDISSGSDAPLDGEAILGPVVLHTSDRVITLHRVQGDVQVDNSRGSVSLTSAGPLGSISVHDRGGSVDVGVPAISSFSVSAQTHDGSIENDFGLKASDGRDQPALVGTVGRGGPAITLETSDGDITLRKASTEPLPATPPQAPAVRVEQSTSGTLSAPAAKPTHRKHDRAS